jgi:Ser/Thr protein kinase RdoA (MazF antagonist)
MRPHDRLPPPADHAQAVGRLCRAWFGDEPVRATPLAGGFSGSRVHLVERPATGERFVLKRFPASADLDRCGWVHAFMRHLRAAGLPLVPAVIERRDGPAFAVRTVAIDEAGCHWELVAFMTGRSTSVPTAAQATAALETLARLHAAAARLPAGPGHNGPAPAIVRRRDQARCLLAAPWQQRRERELPQADTPIMARLDRAIQIFSEARGSRSLERMAAAEWSGLAVQGVLRDIWSDHVLFAERGDDVSAIIDYHAAGIDTPATDLARLLGSWTSPEARRAAPLLETWRDAIAAYERVRPLSRLERALVPWLDATGVILGLDNWFRWTLEERREFADAARVCARIDRFLAALGPALETAANPPGKLD